MSWNASLPMDTSKISLSAGYLRNNQSSVQTVVSNSNLTNAYPYIPTTAPVWFYANVAPSGWTLVGAISDSLLAVKGGSSAYNVSGGTQAGTWNGPGYTLQLADIPAHNHTYQSFNTSGGGSNPAGGGSATPLSTLNTSTVGGGGSHSHNYTSTRPQAYVGVICTKNA